MPDKTLLFRSDELANQRPFAPDQLIDLSRSECHAPTTSKVGIERLIVAQMLLPRNVAICWSAHLQMPSRTTHDHGCLPLRLRLPAIARDLWTETGPGLNVERIVVHC